MPSSNEARNGYVNKKVSQGYPAVLAKGLFAIQSAPVKMLPNWVHRSHFTMRDVKEDLTKEEPSISPVEYVLRRIRDVERMEKRSNEDSELLDADLPEENAGESLSLLRALNDQIPKIPEEKRCRLALDPGDAARVHALMERASRHVKLEKKDNAEMQALMERASRYANQGPHLSEGGQRLNMAKLAEMLIDYLELIEKRKVEST